MKKGGPKAAFVPPATANQLAGRISLRPAAHSRLTSHGGKALDSTDVIVFTLADGAITEATAYSSNYPAGAAFWS
jgi:ketosteroid isomerase-like protein